MPKTTGRDLAFRTARAIPEYPWKRSAATAATLGLAPVAGLAWPDVATGMYLAGGTGTATLAAYWNAKHVMRRGSTKGSLVEDDTVVGRAGGVASRLDILQYASAGALREKARHIRPETYGKASRLDILRADPTEFGCLIAELGSGWGWAGEQVWSSVENTTARFGGPRTYKSLSLACHGLDATGALVTTSTRIDLAEHVHQARDHRRVRKEPGQAYTAAVELEVSKSGTGTEMHRAVCHEPGCRWDTSPTISKRTAERRAEGHRAKHARSKWTTEAVAVHFFNPSGYVDIPSTVRWSVLTGCRDFPTAKRRAADLIPDSGDNDAERWDRQARRIMALFLHAAAMGKPDGTPYRATDVMRWAGDADKKGRSVIEVVDALNRGGKGGATRAAEARAHWETNEKTLTSITNSMMPALSWLSDDRARDLGDAELETCTLDIERLILERETLHLLGHEDQSGLAPLIAAVVAEIAHQARRLAGKRRGGRLDPPLTLLLDEVALVCPVPLDKWTADMGGRGVTIHISAQSLAQMRQRWGVDGAGTILGNVGTLIFYGGSKNADDLQAVSVLTGDRRQKVHGAGQQEEKREKVPVLTAAQIGQLETRKALILQRGLRPVVGFPPITLERPGWEQIHLVDREPEPTLPGAMVAVDVSDMLPQQQKAGESL